MKQGLFRRKGILMIMATAISFSMLVGCGNENVPMQTAPTETTTNEAFNVSITDATGETITLTSRPERIVSLAPSTTEILAALGVEDEIVGRTEYCNYPESIEDVEEVGDTSNPNLEAIISLDPDLVVSSIYVSEEIVNKLRELGIPVVFFNEQEGFEGTYTVITSIGELVGESEKAAEIVANMKETVKDTTEKVNALNKVEKPKIYYMVGYGEQDFTAGGGTFIGQIINLAGGENIAQSLDSWLISKEQIANNPPDMIIMPTNTASLKDLQNAEFYKDLKAVKEGQVYEIDGDMISRQGPRIAEALVEMAEIINPELANN